MAMCCKHSKYHIETTFFTCTRRHSKSKKSTQKIPQIRSKNDQKSVPKAVQKESLKKRTTKSFKFRKKSKNGPKLGPKKRGVTVPNFVILSFGVPLGTYMAPRPSKRGPWRLSRVHFYCFWELFFGYFRSICIYFLMDFCIIF